MSTKSTDDTEAEDRWKSICLHRTTNSGDFVQLSSADQIKVLAVVAVNVDRPPVRTGVLRQIQIVEGADAVV